MEFQLSNFLAVFINFHQKILLLSEELNVPLHRVMEIIPYFPTVLFAFCLTWCMMEQNTAAWREVSLVLFHPSFHVVRVRRCPLSPVARGQGADFQRHLTSQLLHVWGKIRGEEPLFKMWMWRLVE